MLSRAASAIEQLIPEQMDKERLIRQAEFHVLQFQFRRAHNLTNVKRFSFHGYISKVLPSPSCSHLL